MKIRSGFVSNSSSSSFIIGVGLVRPGKEKEVAEIYGENSIESLMDMITEIPRPRWGVPQVDDDGTISLEAFSCYSVEISRVWDKLKELGLNDINIVHFNERGDEPEYDDETGRYNYSWYEDADAFGPELEKKHNLLRDNRDLFIEGDVRCGGGYDG
ncbi:hypothetical protein [Enterobacter phage vB_EcRAM-01]|nr:hypothetical protein [Enterobacter phage vB_EcRAM-01]